MTSPPGGVTPRGDSERGIGLADFTLRLIPSGDFRRVRDEL
jgi:hypothetical protein